MVTEKAILAGGCFWGMQDLIRKLELRWRSELRREIETLSTSARLRCHGPPLA